MSNVKKPTPITSWYDEIDDVEYPCITTNQAEAYANERVREALDKVMGILDEEVTIGTSAQMGTAKYIRIRVSALIPKQ